MKKAVLLYGRFSEKIATLPECNPNDERNWMGWTKKQLVERGYQVICPIIPNVWEAPYGEWKKALDEAGVDADTVLVGLSAGGAACVRYIAEEKKAISKLILIAPARYAEGEDPLSSANNFYNFQVSDSVKKQIKNGTTIFVSNDEPLAGIQDSVKIYEKELGAKVVRFEDRGHFSFLIKTFPELVEEISCQNMRYCLASVLTEPFATYHWDLVSSIAEHFPKLIGTKEQSIPAHFTLKYEFETNNVAQAEKVLEQFAQSHKPVQVSLGGFDKFSDIVIFIKVNLSREAKTTFDELIDTLQGLSWMQWQQHDGKNLHFHSTIAEECAGQDEAVMEFVKNKEQYFESNFDNITMFVETGKTEHGYRKWEVYKRFDFNAGRN